MYIHWFGSGYCYCSTLHQGFFSHPDSAEHRPAPTTQRSESIQTAMAFEAKALQGEGGHNRSLRLLAGARDRISLV